MLEIALVKTGVALGISIREYRLLTVSAIARTVGTLGDVDLATTEVRVAGPQCAQGESFSLAEFIACALATGTTACPICGKNVEIAELVVVEKIDISQV
jgi:hypothetical protein